MILSLIEKISLDAWNAHPNIGEYEPAALRREAYILERFLWDMTVKCPLTAAHFIARGETCYDVIHSIEAVENPHDFEQIRTCIKSWHDDSILKEEEKHP